MQWRKVCALVCALVVIVAPSTTGMAATLLPPGTVFTPPGAAEMDFGRDLPVPREAVEKDTRVVAVIFSVNEVDAMREAFPEVENLDLISLAGRPIIQHVIDGLQTSAYIDRIIVVADPAVHAVLGAAQDPMLTFLVDHGDATENVKHGIGEIARGDLVLLLQSDLLLIDRGSLDPLVEHAREYQDIDVFFPLLQRERCTDEITREHRFIRFKEGHFTGAHVELVRPALFVDNAQDVEGERGAMYEVYGMRKNTLGIVRFLGLQLTLKFLFNDLSPTDVATRIYKKYHVRAQAFVTDHPELATDFNSPEQMALIEAHLRTRVGPAVAEAVGAGTAPDPT